ncbi:MAG: FliM/FliN family flagellar motor switch protein [Treponema sp.]|nr:FliM/FliN family flagellar motor switch protein [Treponema sp.]
MESDIFAQDEIDRLLLPVGTEPNPVVRVEDVSLHRISCYDPKKLALLTRPQCDALTDVFSLAVASFHNAISGYRLMEHVSFEKPLKVECATQGDFFRCLDGTPFLYTFRLSGARCFLSVDQSLVYGFLLGQREREEEKGAETLNPRLYIDAIDAELCKKKIASPYLASLCVALIRAGFGMGKPEYLCFTRHLQSDSPSEPGIQVYFALEHAGRPAYMRLFLPASLTRKLGNAVSLDYKRWQGKTNTSVSIGGFNWQDGMSLTPGSIVTLDKLCGEPVDIIKAGRIAARGEIITVDDHFGVRILEPCGE